ncbi:MAG: TerC family protein [Actinobacteria bacterium]|nr:TerC family protein [Actinomycetota bacterium]
MPGDATGANLVTSVLQIVLFDLILSGDNAVVIGVVASRLHGRQRRLAIVFGAGAAIVLRMSLAAVATFLLNFPVLAAVGGVALFWIGVRLLKPEGGERGGHREATSMREAMQVIILADVVMSLDNVLTVAGAAHGNVWLLIFGLALSMPLLFVGAGLIALAAEKLPLIIYLGSALVFRVAGTLIVEDAAIRPFWEGHPFLDAVVAATRHVSAPGQSPSIEFLEHGLPWLLALLGPLAYVLWARGRGRAVIPIWVNRFTRTVAEDSPAKTN